MTEFIDRYLTMIVGLAIIAVLISQRSSTVQVLQTLASIMSNILGSIVAPISSGAAKSASTAPLTPTAATIATPAGTALAPSGPLTSSGVTDLLSTQGF